MIIVGDSHVEALGPALQERLGADVAYVAKRGYSSADYVKATDWQPQLAGHAVVVYVLSTNDAAKGLSPIAIDAAWRSLIATAWNAGAKRIYIVGAPTFKDAALTAKALPVIAQLSTIIPKLGAYWIDGRPLSTKGPWGTDGIHQTIAGYGRWADNLVPLLVTPEAPALATRAPGDVTGLIAGLVVTGGLMLAGTLGLRALDR